MNASTAPNQPVDACETQDGDPVGLDERRSGERRLLTGGSAGERSIQPLPHGLWPSAGDGDDLELTGRELIALPSPEEPFATLYRDSYGVWVLERPGQPVRYPRNHDVCEVAGRRWRLRCGLASDGKRFAQRRPPMRLTFFTSADGECEEIDIVTGSRKVTVRTRNEDYLLLLLARRRLTTHPPIAADSETGFVAEDECARALGQTPRQLDVCIYRVRNRLASLGVPCPADVIERRPVSRQLRLGTPDVAIQTRAPRSL